MLPYHPHYSGQWCGTKQKKVVNLEQRLSFKIMLLRAVTFFKDLISNNAYKLLSSNLSFTLSVWCLTLSLWRQKGKNNPTAFSCLPQGSESPTQICLSPRTEVHAHGSNSRRNSVKRNAEPLLSFWNLHCVAAKCLTGKQLLSFLPPTVTPTFPGRQVRRRQKESPFFLHWNRTVKNCEFHNHNMSYLILTGVLLSSLSETI